MTSKKKSGVLFLLLAFYGIWLVSCTRLDVFEKNTVIPGYKWQSGFEATGNFNITDTQAAYNIYLVLRHTDAYKYNNIWLNLHLQAPGDTLDNPRLNLRLGSDDTGWEGTGMNDIWEVRKLLNETPRHLSGIYQFSISQIMRDNPLPNVMSVGLRIEKTTRN